MTRPLTPSQARTLAFIVGYVGEHGYAPSREEMQTHLRFKSRAWVDRLVMALIVKGRITQDGPRAIRIKGVRWMMQPTEVA